MIRLRHGAFELELAPRTGGSVRAFRAGGRELLRPAPADPSAGPLEMAAFPLVPFAGRIAGGTFELDGTRIALPANFPPEPHTIHGQGWQASWAVAERSAAQAVLRYEHPGDPWPWRYRVEQRFALDDHGLSLELSLTNQSERVMPAGLGWHPYFVTEGASLTADVGTRWRFDPDTLAPAPEQTAAGADLKGPCAAADLAMDDVFEAGAGGARIRWPDAEVAMTASGIFRFLVVYAPRDRPFFCVEPISHAPNALNSPLPPATLGLVTLAPGATQSGVVRLTVSFREGR